ncbi:MAG: hypothetical protein IRZ28_20090 [Steroidobacteraceae bacterium]|nr:hypothetical protein [Steroidobacteraceae bacterium]
MSKCTWRVALRGVWIAGLACLAAVAGAQERPAAPTPPARPGLTPKQIDELSHRHPGYWGALAPQNLSKPRPKPPFDLTGTWFVDLRRAFADFRFGPPYPEFYEAGKQALKEAAEAQAAGKRYRDSIGQCYPAGMPMIMTRVWPIAMVQLPTVIYMMFGFTNSLRIIYLDGRQHTDPDIVVPTYNGESIGHWEDDTLVVHTKYFETNEHWIDSGIPISDQFEIVERIRMLDGGKTLEIEYIMTDPKNWKGEWRSTKRWLRMDESDISEVECLPNLNRNLPSTAEGSAEVDRRASESK